MTARLGPSLMLDPPLLFLGLGFGVDSGSAVAVARLCEFLFMCAYSSPITKSTALSKIDNQFAAFAVGEERLILSAENRRVLQKGITRIKTMRSTVIAVPAASLPSERMKANSFKTGSSKAPRCNFSWHA